MGHKKLHKLLHVTGTDTQTGHHPHTEDILLFQEHQGSTVSRYRP